MPIRPFPPLPLVRAVFRDRPNRFVVRARLGDGGSVRAFLPNPGRLRELFLPEVPLILADTPREGRRTRYTVMAVERAGAWIFLHTHLTNTVAETLLHRRAVPGLERYTVLRREVTVGRSRFDFLLRADAGDELLLEVKSVTLYGRGVAMFPDAVTERGRRHLEHLAALARAGTPTAVLFLAHVDRCRFLLPDHHTDLAFARTFLAVREEVRLLPVALRWRGDLRLDGPPRPLAIPWDVLEGEARDGGSYLLLLRLPRARRIRIGASGEHRFEPGHYVYVGSAVRGLSARLARHRRKRKRLHWHIDSLRQACEVTEALPIRSSRRDECDLAGALRRLYPEPVAGFGSSDCDCPSHLFFPGEDPMRTRAFHDVLEVFRMGRAVEGRADR